MKKYASFVVFFLYACYAISACSSVCAADQTSGDASSASDGYRAHFLEMCDLSLVEMERPLAPFFERYRKNEDPKTHHYPFFMDSYAIRPLCVAYDMTGEKKYLEACNRWADLMVDFQRRMTPKGAYYLNYGAFRQPGQERGQWFVADSGSIAAALLAVAVRTDDGRRKRCLDSIKSFARMVIDNYVSSGGGVTDGLWTYKGEWWASTAIFGTFMVLAYNETGDQEYLKTALRAADWFNRRDFSKENLPEFDTFNPCTIFYCGEFFAVVLPHIEAGTPRRERTEKQIAEVLAWLAKNQKGRGAQSDWKYSDKGKVYMPGNPYFMFLLARDSAKYQDQKAAADQELNYVDDLLFREGKPRETDLEVWGMMTFGMMSYAEKLSPGGLFRASGKN
ncbi:MAG: hypothetical protein JW959_04490 [Pirellulales bacterium]|nr:hypothetical protein [Pirellulales bacterium]